MNLSGFQAFATNRASIIFKSASKEVNILGYSAIILAQRPLIPKILWKLGAISASQMQEFVDKANLLGRIHYQRVLRYEILRNMLYLGRVPFRLNQITSVLFIVLFL